MKSEQVVQQNKASGKVRRQAEVTFTYTPNGPTFEALLKTLLRWLPMELLSASVPSAELRRR